MEFPTVTYFGGVTVKSEVLDFQEDVFIFLSEESFDNTPIMSVSSCGSDNTLTLHTDLVPDPIKMFCHTIQHLFSSRMKSLSSFYPVGFFLV